MITVSPLNGVLSRMAHITRAMDEVNGHTEDSYSSGQYWTPAMDAWETEQAFVVQLDLPGVTAEQVDVSFDRNASPWLTRKCSASASMFRYWNIKVLGSGPKVASRSLTIRSARIESKPYCSRSAAGSIRSGGILSAVARRRFR